MRSSGGPLIRLWQRAIASGVQRQDRNGLPRCLQGQRFMGQQLEAGREFSPTRRARDHDASRLKRLA